MSYAEAAAGAPAFEGVTVDEKDTFNAGRERVTLRLPSALYQRLEDLRAITHASNANEVVKNALLFYDALVRERLSGNDVYVISPDGEKTRYSVFL